MKTDRILIIISLISMCVLLPVLVNLVIFHQNKITEERSFIENVKVAQDIEFSIFYFSIWLILGLILITVIILIITHRLERTLKSIE